MKAFMKIEQKQDRNKKKKKKKMSKNGIKIE